MKQLLIITCCLLIFAVIGCSQKLKAKNLPLVVKTAFDKAYGKPGTVKWDKEDKDNYEASFTLRGKEISVVYSGDGTLLETESEIDTGELPSPVKEYINSHYKNARISEAAKIVKKDGKVIYEAEVNKKDLLFDASGALLETDN